MTPVWATALSVQRGASAFMVLSMLLGCRARTGELGPAGCRPVASPLAPGATAAEIAGEYRLVLVADSASSHPERVTGTLRLEPYEGVLRQRTRLDGSLDSTTIYAAFGSTDIDLSAVGAAEVGSTQSEDPVSPGVVVLERRTVSGKEPATNILLRLGSEANRRDRQRFDGGYTALYVRSISADQFAGDWASAVAGPSVKGHFCAMRKDG